MKSKYYVKFASGARSARYFSSIKAAEAFASIVDIPFDVIRTSAKRPRVIRKGHYVCDPAGIEGFVYKVTRNTISIRVGRSSNKYPATIASDLLVLS